MQRKIFFLCVQFAHLSEAEKRRERSACTALRAVSSVGGPNPAPSDMRLSSSMLRNTNSSWNSSQGRASSPGWARESTRDREDNTASSSTLSELEAGGGVYTHEYS